MATTAFGSWTKSRKGLKSAAAAVLSQPADRQPALDGLRVAAAAAVLVSLVAGATGYAFTGTPESWLVTRGDVGIAIFFTLSGFLLYKPWATAALDGGSAPATTAYVCRRAVRLLPAYWAVVIVGLLVANGSHVHTVVTWAQYLLSLQNYDPHPWWTGTGAAGLGQLWTMAVQLSFYAVLPLLAAILAWSARVGSPGRAASARRLLIGIAVLGAISCLFTGLAYHPAPQLWLRQTLPTLMIWFTPGMALAVLAAWAGPDHGGARQPAIFCRTIASSAAPCFAIAGLCFVLACTPIAGPEGFAVPSLSAAVAKTLLYAIIATAVVAPAALRPAPGDKVTKVLGSRPLQLIARVTYGWFLWESLIIYEFFRVLKLSHVGQASSYNGVEVAGITVAIALLALLAGTVSLLAIELPAAVAYRSLAARRTVRHRVLTVDPAEPAGITGD
jgi:peptidoglycan/LPS O-acetylase OafA/YrhL